MLKLEYSENGLHTGQLHFKKGHYLRQVRAHPTLISIVPLFAADRQDVECFIKDIYARSYAADIAVHYPMLMSVRDENGRILAATGFRYALEDTLFLEQYLDAPIEQVLGAKRAQIVEIGNLASDGGGASLYLFAALSAYLNSKGLTKAVVTSTDFLEKRFRMMGLKPERHGKADPSLLLSEGENWGTYYDTQPHVLSGSIADGYQRLQKQMGMAYTDYRPRLFPRLHYKFSMPATK